MPLGRLFSFLAVMIALVTPVKAGQNCGSSGNKTSVISSPIMLSGHYDPTSSTNATMTGSIQLTTPNGLGPCVTLITFSRSQPGGLSGPGGAHLAYWPTDAFLLAEEQGLNISVDGNGNSSPVNGGVVIPAGQVVPAGTYSETRIVSVQTGQTVLSQQTMTLQEVVSSSCTLPLPSETHLDFSGGIHGDHVAGGYKLSTAINGASCNGPSRLSLQGSALTSGGAARAGFGAGIDYMAQASFRGSSVSLSTTNAATAATTVSPGAGDVQIDVALIDGGIPLQAGHYASMLTIVLEPAN